MAEQEPKHPKYLVETPWYTSEDSPSKRASQEETKDTKKARIHEANKYEEKRDRYDSYNPDEYRGNIDKFHLVSVKNAALASSEKIVDPFSRVVASESKRDIKDTAHYLKDISGEFDFESSNLDIGTSQVTSAGEPAVSPKDIPKEKHYDIRTLIKESCLRDWTRSSDSDPHSLGHTCIYGSYWRNGAWGYRCCNQLSPSAKCKAPASL